MAFLNKNVANGAFEFYNGEIKKIKYIKKNKMQLFHTDWIPWQTSQDSHLISPGFFIIILTRLGLHMLLLPRSSTELIPS